MAGKVIRVDIPVDKDGRSRGFAVVEFDHPVEAVQAISMFHNQVLFDRPMTVRMDRANETFKLPEGLKSIGMGLGPNGEPLKNVAHNLPSLANSQQGAGAGILGAVPGNSLQLASALTGLGNVGLNPQMLQAANLTGLATNLLGNGLGGADLTSLVATAQNPLVQNPQQFAAMTQNPQSNMSNSSGMGSFGRNSGENTYNTQGSGFAPQGQAQNYSSNVMGGRNFQQQSNQSAGFSNAGYTNERQPFGNNSGNMIRSQTDRGADKGYSRKVLVSNVSGRVGYLDL